MDSLTSTQTPLFKDHTPIRIMNRIYNIRSNPEITAIITGLGAAGTNSHVPTDEIKIACDKTPNYQWMIFIHEAIEAIDRMNQTVSRIISEEDTTRTANLISAMLIQNPSIIQAVRTCRKDLKRRKSPNAPLFQEETYINIAHLKYRILPYSMATTMLDFAECSSASHPGTGEILIHPERPRLSQLRGLLWGILADIRSEFRLSYEYSAIPWLTNGLALLLLDNPNLDNIIQIAAGDPSL